MNDTKKQNEINEPLTALKVAARTLTDRQLKQGYTPQALHIYRDHGGAILYARIRMLQYDGMKWIRPLSLDDADNWQLKEPDFKALGFINGKPLYNLHLIASNLNQPMYVVEGEKCADALVKLGLIATTSGGAGSANDANWEILRNREVIIWADNDDAGKQYACDVQAKLISLNVMVKQIDVDQLHLPAKGDCVDWLQQFHQQHGHNATKFEIDALPVINNSSHNQASNYFERNYGVVSIINVSLLCAKDITPEPIQWLWDGWLAKGKLHIFAGQAGTGKTTIAIALAATITTGGRFPDGSKSPMGSVLIWSGEDSAADTLVPRLMAAGADLSKVHFVGDTTEDYELRGFDPATDMPPLMARASELSDLALLIVDPIVNAVAGDSHKNGEVRRSLQPVVDFGEKLNCAVLGITHFSKGGQGKEPLERVTGSLAFGALARIVLATAKIVDGDKTKRIVCRAKSNIGMDSGGFEYDLQEVEVQAGIFSSYALWGDAVEGNARELLAEPDNRETGENGKSALEDAKDFLLTLLADGEMAQKEIEAEAKGAGHSSATIRRAKSELHIHSSKSVLDKRWYWKLSSNMLKKDEDAQDVHINNVSMLSTLPIDRHIQTEIIANTSDAHEAMRF